MGLNPVDWMQLVLWGGRVVGWLLDQLQRPDEQLLRTPILAQADHVSATALEFGADVLSKPQGTILVWVNVPPRGHGIRQPDNGAPPRYVFSHGSWRGSNIDDAFCLRHDADAGGVWLLFVTQVYDAQPAPKPLRVPDVLEPGWRHFAITWSMQSRGSLELLIDGKRGAREAWPAIEAQWPRPRGSFAVGRWCGDSAASDMYANTEIAGIRVYSRRLSNWRVKAIAGRTRPRG